MQKILIYILFFFYIFSVQLIGIPYNSGTRIVISLLGVVILFFTFKNKIFFSTDFLKLAGLLFLLSVYSMFSLSYNISNDYQFVVYPISILLIFFASFFVVNIAARIDDERRFLNLMNIIINIIFIQLIISIIMFAFAPFKDFLDSIQVYSDLDEGKIEETMAYRLIGFGSKFFGSGIVNGFALILIASILKNEVLENKKMLRYIFIYLFVFFFGMMSARTTIIGFSISLCSLLFPFATKQKAKGKGNMAKIISYIIGIPIILFLLILTLFPSSIEYFDKLFGFGFEMFINYFETGNASSTSVEAMNEMYLWPKDEKTYWIGDGLFTDPYTKLYYQGTDIGYLRLIYYFGIPGTIIYLLTHLYLIIRLTKKYPDYKIMFTLIMFYFLILNLKGFTDLIFLLVLFLYGSENKINLNKSQIALQ